MVYVHVSSWSWWFNSRCDIDDAWPSEIGWKNLWTGFGFQVWKRRPRWWQGSSSSSALVIALKLFCVSKLFGIHPYIASVPQRFFGLSRFAAGQCLGNSSSCLPTHVCHRSTQMLFLWNQSLKQPGPEIQLNWWFLQRIFGVASATGFCSGWVFLHTSSLGRDLW